MITILSSPFCDHHDPDCSCTTPTYLEEPSDIVGKRTSEYMGLMGLYSRNEEKYSYLFKELYQKLLADFQEEVNNLDSDTLVLNFFIDFSHLTFPPHITHLVLKNLYTHQIAGRIGAIPPTIKEITIYKRHPSFIFAFPTTIEKIHFNYGIDSKYYVYTLEDLKGEIFIYEYVPKSAIY